MYLMKRFSINEKIECLSKKNSNLGKSFTVFFGTTYLFTVRENETTNQLLSSISFMRLFSLPDIPSNSIGNILG